MRLAPGIVILLMGLSFQFHNTNAYGQTFTSEADSLLARLTVDSATTTQQKKFFLIRLKGLDRPGKAALMSAALPGLGQVYNDAWWKVPIIYATGGVLAYYIIDINRKYQDFEEAVNLRRTKADKYVDDPRYGLQRPNNFGTTQLYYSRDVYRRNRDLMIIISVLAYGLNISEAYVHAHMNKFDVSDNLSLRLQPDLLQIQVDQNMMPGLSLTLYTRTK